MMQYLSLHTLDQTYASAKLPANPLLRAEALRRLAWYILFQDTLVDAGIIGDHLVTENTYSIQLPCDEENFEAGREVQTRPLDLGTTNVFAPPQQTPQSPLPTVNPNLGMSAHLIRVALCRRRILHFNSSIEASMDSADTLMSRFNDIDSAMRDVIVALPPEFAYNKQNMARFERARMSFVQLHTLRHNCFLMLSLARINIALKQGQPDSAVYTTRQDRIRHALAVSRIIEDVIGQNVLSELMISSQVYSCIESECLHCDQARFRPLT